MATRTGDARRRPRRASVDLRGKEQRSEQGRQGENDEGGRGWMAPSLSPRSSVGRRGVGRSSACAGAASERVTARGRESGMGQVGWASRHCALRVVHSGVYLFFSFSVFFFFISFCFIIVRPLLLFCKIWDLAQILQCSIPIHQKLVWARWDFV